MAGVFREVEDRARPVWPVADHRGFSLVELLVALVLGSIVVLSAGQLLVTHSRLFSRQTELGNAQETLRSAGAFLASELMRLSADGSDLVFMNKNDLWIRSVEASGVVCSFASAGADRRVGLRQVTGSFSGSVGDTIVAYQLDSNTWAPVLVKDGWDGKAAWSAGSTPTCDWGKKTTADPRPEAAVLLSGTPARLAQIRMGAIVQRSVHQHYRLREINGRWWLIRDTRGGVRSDVVAGPFRAPTKNGLVFTYLDANGAQTGDPTRVRRIQIHLIAEGMGGASVSGRTAANTTPWDSTTIEVSVHGRRG